MPRSDGLGSDCEKIVRTATFSSSATSQIEPVSSLKPINILLLSGAVALAQQFTISTIAGGAPPSTPAAPTTVSIGSPQRSAVDASGNLYFTGSNCVFKLGPNGVLTVIAGTSRPGNAGDNGPATNARLNGPQGVAIDGSGNIYIADSLNHAVRMISGGIITTIVGYGTPGYTGDGGLGNGAQLNLPGGLAIDGKGNLYIADTGNHVIRLLSPAGTIITFAGTSIPGFAGDGAAATAARLFDPADVAVDFKGNVFIADTENNVIREVTTDGNISTVAGNRTAGNFAEGVDATSAFLSQPHGVAVDSAGSVYISDFGASRVRKVAQGKITTVAGTGVFGFSGDGSQAAKAQLANPWGVSVDSSGNLYIADFWNYRIRQVSSSGTISTVAGNGLVSYSGDGGQAASAQLNGPRGAAVDAAGNLYIADTENHTVRRVTRSGVIANFAGNGSAGFAGDGSQAAGAQLSRPQAVTVDAAGNVYIADTGNHRVRAVSTSGVITSIAGNGSPGFGGDGGPAASAQLNAPRGLAVDASGNLYVADFNNNLVRKISNGTITTAAGTGLAGFSGDGGPASKAQLRGPISVAVDGVGNLYIADYGNYRVRVVSRNGVINTIAGNGTSVSTGDGGPAVNAQLAAPGSLAVDAAGNLYIGDSIARVREIFSYGTIATIAGDGTIGYSGDGGPALSARLNGSSGLAVDGAYNVYVADTGNNSIRRLQPSDFGLTLSSVANGASLLPGPVAAGEVVVLYGFGLGPNQLATYRPDINGGIPTNLAGTTVVFNGTPASILYSWATQVAAIVPATVSGANAQVFVQYQNQTSAALTLPVAPAAPGLFTVNSSGQGQAAALNQDGSLNGAGNPALVGSTISVFATGIPASPGFTYSGPVTIGGKPATVQSVRYAPNGVLQINALVPAGIAAGSAVPVIVPVGSVSSQNGVTISVTGGS